MAFLEGLAPAIEREPRAPSRTARAGPEQIVTASAYLLQVALPGLWFHVTTAYDILRHNGVALRKADYLSLS